MYSVNFWGSHPDSDQDDCWYGSDFSTVEEATKAFNIKCDDSSVAYVELTVYTGKKIGDAAEVDRIQLRPNPTFRPKKDNYEDWRHEIAMEAGMLHGCDAYNEAMGW